MPVPELGNVNRRLEGLQARWLEVAERNLDMVRTAAGTSRAKGWAIISAIASDKVLLINNAISNESDLSAVGAWLAHLTEEPPDELAIVEESPAE